MATTAGTAKKVLRVLHVGVGNRGAWPLEKCSAATGFEPAALCDVSEAALEAARQRTGLGASACFTDYGEALRRAEADCVVICAPTVLHVDMTLAAVAAGYPVLVEKGMAPSWAEARRLVSVVEASGVRVCVAQNYRYNPVEATIARALRDADHPAHPGAVHLVTYAQHRVRPIPRTLTYPFASVWDMSCHHYDNLLAWCGPIARVAAHGWRAAWSAYEHPSSNVAAHLVFDSGARGHYLHTHDAARGSVEVQVHGERGALVYDGRTLTFNDRPTEQFGARPARDVTLDPAEGEADLLRDFHRYLTEGVEPGISAAKNLETMAACEMTVRSIDESRAVERGELGA